MLSSYRGLSREAKLLLACSGIWGLMMGMHMTIWQLYLKSAGYSGIMIGAYSLTNGLAMTLLVIPSGYVADRFGKKVMGILSTILASTSAFLIASSTKLPFLLSSALMRGTSQALRGPSIEALMADKADHRVEELYSLSSFINGAASATGSLLGWIPEILVLKGMSYFNAYRLLILSSAFIELSALAPLMPIREKRADKEAHAGKILRIKANRILVKLFSLNALVGLGAGLSIPLIGYYMSVKFKVESGPIGTMFTISSILGSISYIAAAPLARKIGLLNGIILPQAISVLLLASIPHAPSYTIAAMLYVPRTALMNMTWPLVRALQMKVCEPQDRATVSALDKISWSLPNSASSQIGGIIMDHISLDLPLYLTSLIYSIYATLFFTLLRREEIEASNLPP